MDKHHFSIHPNGDSPESMKENFIAVMNAARNLEKAIRKCAPNSRNYYVNLNGEAELRDDSNDYLSMLHKVEEIREWAEEGAVHVLEQEGK